MSSADNYRRWIVEGLAPYLGKKVAEVGAGIGSITRVLLERGRALPALLEGVLPWYVHFTLLGRGMGRGSVTLYDRLVVPAMRVVENAVRPPIGKNVLLVARRT